MIGKEALCVLRRQKKEIRRPGEIPGALEKQRQLRSNGGSLVGHQRE